MLVKATVLSYPVPNLLHFPQSSLENLPFISVSVPPQRLRKVVLREALLQDPILAPIHFKHILPIYHRKTIEHRKPEYLILGFRSNPFLSF